MPFMKCPGCAGDIEYKKGEWRVKCPYCGEWRETGEPKPPEPKPPQPKPAVPGRTETVEHYLERLRKWRRDCAKVIIIASIIFFAGAAIYMKVGAEPGMPVVLLGAAFYFIAPRLFANSRPRPYGPPASEKVHVPFENATWFSYILIDIAVGAVMAFTAIQIFGPFEWK